MIYRIVTYDKATERMRASMRVPPSLLEQVKKVAGVHPQDDGLGEYPLDDAQTRELGRVLGFGPMPDLFYYYFEPYEPTEHDGLEQPQAEAR
jgi:hypothetical protein